jgi:hypothetical protein
MSDPALAAFLRWCAEAFSLAVLVGAAFFILRQWGEIPARVPAHFDLRGEPDRWSGRWILLFLMGVMAVMYVGMSAGGGTLGLIEGRQEGPVRQAVVLTWVKLNVMLTFGYTLWSMVRVARGEARRMNVRIIVALAVVMILPVYLFRPD